MNNIKILDCTLRDGGRLFNCAFEDPLITKIIDNLSFAKIDYIEVGFLRDTKLVKCKGNSTFFNKASECSKFIKDNSKSEFLVFCDFGMFDFNTLENAKKTRIDGIRLGFTKQDYLHHWDKVKECFKIVKNKGYKLFIQGVNSLSYSKDEFIKLLKEINKIKPFAFGLVDTYGAMSIEDVDSYFNCLSKYLENEISIDFHSHNNKQMAFALAQEIIKINKNRRKVIIDASLNGLGKGAGNLNLELIINYLNDKKISNYDFDCIFDLIDEEILPLRNKYQWGYSLANFIGGIYKSHPNNIIYLTEKFRLRSKDIKNIVSMINPLTRQKYDYDNIEKIYIDYSSSQIDDSKTISNLYKFFADKNVLVLAPGKSIDLYKNKIDLFIKKKKPIVISVNFLPQYKNSWSFFASPKKFANTVNQIINNRTIVTSNIKDNKYKYIVSYHGLIDRRYRLFDNSALMLLKLLSKLSIKHIYIAGLDGYSKNNNDFMSNYKTKYSNKSKLNKEISNMINDYINETSSNFKTTFITPTKYRIKQ